MGSENLRLLSECFEAIRTFEYKQFGESLGESRFQLQWKYEWYERVLQSCARPLLCFTGKEKVKAKFTIFHTSDTFLASVKNHNLSEAAFSCGLEPFGDTEVWEPLQLPNLLRGAAGQDPWNIPGDLWVSVEPKYGKSEEDKGRKEVYSLGSALLCLRPLDDNQHGHWWLYKGLAQWDRWEVWNSRCGAAGVLLDEEELQLLQTGSQVLRTEL